MYKMYKQHAELALIPYFDNQIILLKKEYNNLLKNQQK
jgi:hypothetical protein